MCKCSKGAWSLARMCMFATCSQVTVTEPEMLHSVFRPLLLRYCCVVVITMGGLYWFTQTTAFVPDLQRLPAGAQSAAEKAAAKTAAKGEAPSAKAAKPRRAPGKRRKAGVPAPRPPVALRSGMHVLLGALHLTWQCL